MKMAMKKFERYALSLCLGILLGVATPTTMEISLSEIRERNMTDEYKFTKYGARFFCLGLTRGSDMKIVQNGSCSFDNPEMTCSGLWGCTRNMCRASFDSLETDNVAYIAYSPYALGSPSATKKICELTDNESDNYYFSLKRMVWGSSVVYGLTTFFIPLLFLKIEFKYLKIIRLLVFFFYVASFVISHVPTWMVLQAEYKYEPTEVFPKVVENEWAIRVRWKMAIYGIETCIGCTLILIRGIAIFYDQLFSNSLREYTILR